MNPVDRVGWITILFLAASAAAFGFASCIEREAHADPPTLRDRIIAAAPSIGSKRETIVAPDELADAVLSATQSRQWAAFLLTVASHESALSARIARGECRPRECDHGRAWGLWQQWETAQNKGQWGSVDLNVQARAASRLASQYFAMCRGSGVPFPLSTFRAYAGRGCLMPLRDEAARMATFARVMARL